MRRVRWGESVKALRVIAAIPVIVILLPVIVPIVAFLGVYWIACLLLIFLG